LRYINTLTYLLTCSIIVLISQTRT